MLELIKKVMEDGRTKFALSLVACYAFYDFAANKAMSDMVVIACIAAITLIVVSYHFTRVSEKKIKNGGENNGG